MSRPRSACTARGAWKILFRRPPQVLPGEAVIGYCNPVSRTILIDPNPAVHKPGSIGTTLLHELKHAILFDAGYLCKHGEKKIDVLAAGLVRALRRNRRLRKLIFEDNDETGSR